MKKTFYLLFMFIGLVFTSCEPMEDIHDEIDAEIEGKIAGTASYTLTEDDYKETLDLSFANFNNVDQAKDLVPTVLEDVFPSFGAESSVNVTFDIYAPKRDEKSLIVYKASSEDEDLYGSGYGNFDRFSQLEDLLNAKFGDEPNRTLVSLTYDWYTSTTGKVVRNDGFLLIDGEWNFITGLTKDEYAALGENYTDFSNEDEALAKIPTFIENKYDYEEWEKGDIKGVMYNLYLKDYDDVDRDGITVDDPDTPEEEPNERLDYGFVVYFIYNGTNWVKYNNIMAHTLKFGHDGTNWVPDNTIRYTLTKADYGIIESALLSKYPGPADNAGYFASFDVRKSSDNYWSDEMLLEAFNVFLNEFDPNAEIGQKYVLSYAVYNGATVTMQISLIKTEAGWVLNN